jgi:hypothetical protein
VSGQQGMLAGTISMVSFILATPGNKARNKIIEVEGKLEMNAKSSP